MKSNNDNIRKSLILQNRHRWRGLLGRCRRKSDETNEVEDVFWAKKQNKNKRTKHRMDQLKSQGWDGFNPVGHRPDRDF